MEQFLTRKPEMTQWNTVYKVGLSSSFTATKATFFIWCKHLLKISVFIHFFSMFFFGPPLLFHDGGPYHIEISPFICSANQRTGFYMIGTSVMKELRNRLIHCFWTKPEIFIAFKFKFIWLFFITLKDR